MGRGHGWWDDLPCPQLVLRGLIWGRAGPEERLQEVGQPATPPIGVGGQSGAGSAGERGCGPMEMVGAHQGWGRLQEGLQEVTAFQSHIQKVDKSTQLYLLSVVCSLPYWLWTSPSNLP